MKRITEEEIFMESARLWAKRSTCSRLSVGCVITKDRHIISSGYNGAPIGAKHCVHLDDTPCTVAIHAEANALLYAARSTYSTVGGTVWVTHSPCLSCAGMMLNAGITTVVYELDYRSTSGVDLLEQANVNVRKYSDTLAE